VTPGDLRSVVGAAPARGAWQVAARVWVERHPFATFVGLAYAFSWSFWLLAGVGGGSVPLLVGGLGPLVAAGVVTRLTGGSLRSWLRPVWRWRVPVR
jgi:hypothetical protein